MGCRELLESHFSVFLASLFARYIGGIVETSVSTIPKI
jgi:hypothetical protein